jgi:hypothetical protein
VFQLVRVNFEQIGAGPVTWGRPQAVRCVIGGLTAWGRRSNRPGQSEQFFCSLLHSRVALLHLFRGVCFGSGGACICAGGAFCVVRALVRWFALFV